MKKSTIKDIAESLAAVAGFCTAVLLLVWAASFAQYVRGHTVECVQHLWHSGK